MIAWAAGLVPRVDLITWVNADDPERGSLSFELRGKNGANPDALAAAIAGSALEKKDSLPRTWPQTLKEWHKKNREFL